MATRVGRGVMHLGWPPHRPIEARGLNIGVVVAVLLATFTAGLMGGLIVWAVWRYDLLRLGDQQP